MIVMSYCIYEYRLKEITLVLKLFKDKMNKDQVQELVCERNSILNDLKLSEDIPHLRIKKI